MSTVENSTIGWDMPLTGGGREDGLNDSGISFFNAEPIKSTAKETTQDTLDARHSKESPALIEYKVEEVPTASIPGIVELRSILAQAHQHFEPKDNETSKFFKKACEIIESDTIKVCAIRDRNTSGLTNVDSTEDSHFHRLTKTTGDTGKTGTSNGSYGIGKHAPFAASYLRAMLYGTLNREGVRGFQGVIKIASFNNGHDYPTQGTGFYGIKQGYKPLQTEEDLSCHVADIFKREDDDYGTDKFILGFNGSDNWEQEIIEAVVSSYMYAILEENLEVMVGDTIINIDTLESVVESIQNFNPDSKVLEFYLSLTAPSKKIFTEDFATPEGTMETVELFVLEGENFHNKVALVRGTGMKIYEKGNFRTPMKFAGTLIVKGERLNEIFRLMEPPTHDDWAPGLYKADIDYAKKLKKELYAWLNQVVRDLTPKFDAESFELPGLDTVLPKSSQEEEPVENINPGTDSEKIKKLIITNNSMNPAKKKKKKPPMEKPDEPKPPVKKPTPPKSAKNKPSIKKIRAFCINPSEGLYKVLISPTNSGEISLKVNLVGESLTSDAPIQEVVNAETKQTIPVKDTNIIGPITVNQDAQFELLLKLDNLIRYSLEVEQV